MHGRDDQKDDDRLSCNLDWQILFPGKNGHEEVRAGVVAVFDGPNGYEASEMASKLLLDYFSLHSTFIADKGMLQFEEENVMVAEEPNKDEKPDQYNSILVSSNGSPSVSSDESRHMGILKEALLRTIRDIDLAFSEATVTKNLRSASTATIVVMVHGHMLVVSVGHPKALLCSEKVHSHEEMEGGLKGLRTNRMRVKSSAILQSAQIKCPKHSGLILKT
ncbi:probable protein phosphatase 2C 51 isoform X2 [Cornus florida]|nr:probable protein phosphatase 2C 51 isoform X2 [Cornus florida]